MLADKDCRLCGPPVTGLCRFGADLQLAHTSQERTYAKYGDLGSLGKLSFQATGRECSNMQEPGDVRRRGK